MYIFHSKNKTINIGHATYRKENVLGITIDIKFSFISDIKTLKKKFNQMLHALKLWMFCSKISLRKIKNIHEKSF